MFSTTSSNIVRTFVGTVGALAISTTFLLAAAGPAEARTKDAAASVAIVDVVSTASPIAY